MSICFKKSNNYTEISNNKYIFDENYTDNSYGLYTGTDNNNYTIINIPREYPIGFFAGSTYDISNYLVYGQSSSDPIEIRVSIGSDFSFNNGDYFRFYDVCNNLINIGDHSSNPDSVLTTSGDNFYFMRNETYKFVAITDFSAAHPFCISGSSQTEDVSLTNIDDSFEITISSEATQESYFYQDINHPDSSGILQLLVDNNGVEYYYGDISINVLQDFTSTLGNISIQSYPNSQVGNNALFYYSDECAYIHTDVKQELSNNSIKCLDIVSSSKFDDSAKTYIFNSQNERYDISYGLFDGSYILLNISEQYPVTLINNDVSDLIYINSLTDPSYTSGGYNYYYGVINIVVTGDFVNSIKLESTADVSDVIFTYTTLCTNSDETNDILDTDICFQLLNAKGVRFAKSDNEKPENVFELDLYSDFLEQEPGYYVRDKYGNDISNLVVSNADQAVIFDLPYFYVYYSVEDYFGKTAEAYRRVEIFRGPFIEISSGHFKNNNPQTDIIELETNTYDITYDFSYIAYVYDNSKKKVYLPIDISLVGNYYGASSTYKHPINPDVSNSTKIVDYAKDIEYGNDNDKYYLSKNIEYNEEGTVYLKLKNIDISTLNKNNEASPIYSEANLYDLTNDEIKLITENNNLITNIDNSNNLIYLRQYYDDAVPNVYDLSTVVYVDDNKFKINITDISNSANNLEISGNFKPTNFYDTNSGIGIDLSFIGDYTLTFSTLGLATGDYLHSKYSGLGLNNISKAITINVHDISNPSIQFNPNITKYLNAQTYTYEFPIGISFDVIEDIDICNNFADVNPNKPVIDFIDNSIYNGDLSYTKIYDVSNSIDKSIINNQLFSSEVNQFIIDYIAYDLCGNSSDTIHLTLDVKDIPRRELLGVLNTEISVNDSSYIDAGIKIIYTKDNVNNDYEPTFSFTDSSYGTDKIIFNNTTFDISYSTDISIGTIGKYDINYIVSVSGSNDSTSISRNILITDTEVPTIQFRNLSSISAVNHYSDPSSTVIEISNSNFPFIGYSTANADFSINVFSSFADLSAILHDFDVSDNYFEKQDISVNISISGSTHYFTESDVDLDAKGLYHFKYYVSDLCNNIGSAERMVTIVDTQPPNINFLKITNLSYNDISLVEYGLNNIDFSFAAGNSDFSNVLQDISKIVYGLNLDDNVIPINQNNYTITPSFSTIKENIRKVDTSFVIRYDFSDNAGNRADISRVVNIFNPIPPELTSTPTTYTISFGDILFNPIKDISRSHPRLDIVHDLSISDISMIFPANIYSISGYDTSGLIYNLGTHTISYEVHDECNNSLTAHTSQQIVISNNGPIFDPPINPSTITHEAGYPISDASLIIGIRAFSEYDKFFYYHNDPDISYTGTHFDISLVDPSFDQFKPKVKAGSEPYLIKYIATDVLGVSTVAYRYVDISDTKGPDISMNGLADIELEKGSVYEESGATAFDIGDDKDVSVNITYYISTDLTASCENIDTTSVATYIVTYTAEDSQNNITDISRTVNIIDSSLNPNPELEPIINISGIDISINAEFNTNFVQYASLNEIFDISYNYASKTFTYEATTQQNFDDNIDFSLIAYDSSQVEIGDSSKNIFHDICANVVKEYQIFFQAFDAYNNITSEIYNFNVVDTTPPVLTLQKMGYKKKK